MQIKKNKINYKHFLIYAGNCVTIISIIYIIYLLIDKFGNIFIYQNFILFLKLIPIYSFFYSLNILLLALSWHFLISIVSYNKVYIFDSLKLYSSTNISKYIPGNIFHFINRQIYGDKLNLTQKNIAFVSIQEILFLLFSSSLLTSLSLIFLDLNFKKFIIIIFFLSSLIIVVFLYINNKKFLPGNSYIQKYFFFTYFKIIFFYILYFLFNGLILITASNLIFDINISTYDYFIYLSGFSFSWLIGFITPGSPGGIGPRDALLASSLSYILPTGDALLLVLFHRIVSILGDFLIYIFCFIYGKYYSKI